MLNRIENWATSILIAEAILTMDVLRSEQPGLAEFWTPWSRPCQVLDSVLLELARELAGKIKVVRINVDDSLGLGLLYNIQSVPTLIYFAKGKACWDIVGTASKHAILSKCTQPHS